MRLIANVIRMSFAKFYCNRLTTILDIQSYSSLIFGAQCRIMSYREIINSLVIFAFYG